MHSCQVEAEPSVVQRVRNEKQLFKCVEGRLYARGTIERYFPQFPLFPVCRGTSASIRLSGLPPLFSCFLFRNRKKRCTRTKVDYRQKLSKMKFEKKGIEQSINSLETESNSIKRQIRLDSRRFVFPYLRFRIFILSWL